MMARPAAPTPETTTRTSRGAFAPRAARCEGGEDHNRGAVLIVVEHRDVEQLAQPAFDLETLARRCLRD